MLKNVKKYEIPIGASISVVFSSGVYNHATDTKEKIEHERQKSISETKKSINENRKNGGIFNEE